MGKGSRARRAQGAGRKRKAGIPRTPSGKLTESKAVRREIAQQQSDQNERAAMHTALDARRRKFGANEDTARDQRWSTVVGRLRMKDEIDEAQYQAALAYAGIHGRYLKSIEAPGQPSNANEPAPCDVCGSYVPCDECAADSANHRSSQRARVQEIVDALCDKVNSRLPALALDNIVLRDIEMPRLHPYLFMALNALAQHFRMKQAAVRRAKRRDDTAPPVATPSALINPNMLGDLPAKS
jgi:hypothetical protein